MSFVPVYDQISLKCFFAPGSFPFLKFCEKALVADPMAGLKEHWKDTD